MAPRALLWLAAACLGCITGCRGFDAAVFDQQLRVATFDAYVDTIEAQFEGLESAGVSAALLRSRYRDAAVEAPSPAAFYGVLRALLSDLDDPHAGLRVSPRFWAGPVAEPEWVQFVEYDGQVHIGLPHRNTREFEAAVAEREAWLEAAGASDVSELTPVKAANLLRSSAAFGPEHPGTERARLRALTEPLAWMPLLSVDGVTVETAHDAELLIRGSLGSLARLTVITPDGWIARLGALRNAGVFEGSAASGGLRRRLDPLELAARLDPRSAAFDGNRPAARAPRQALIARRRWFREAIRGPGDPVGEDLLSGDWLEPFGIEARRLVTPAGEEVAFLRIGSFRFRGDEGDPEAPSMELAFAEVARLFRDDPHWIIDLTGNPGGSWGLAGLFMSYFLSPEEAIVPHEVRSVREQRAFLSAKSVSETHRLRRSNVQPLSPASVHVLVDQDTASAGEIVAAFLRGTQGAALVGERTAGAEFGTGEFLAPDGSVLSIGLGGGMIAPLPHFQGRGLEVDVELDGTWADLEAWRATFALRARSAALAAIDRGLGAN